MLGFLVNKNKDAEAKRKRSLEFQGWFDGLDEESQQETTLKYLRKLDKSSLKRLYEAVELYREADKILRDKVKEPEVEEEDDNNLNKEDLKNNKGD